MTEEDIRILRQIHTPATLYDVRKQDDEIEKLKEQLRILEGQMKKLDTLQLLGIK